MENIAVIISYCTNDYRFLSKCIEQARLFSDQIIVAVCDHFFDGTPENRFLLEHTYANHPDCLFLEFAYMPDRIYSSCHRISADDPDWPIYWAAASRYIGFHYIAPQIETVLFLDSDEIVEGKEFLNWFRSGAFSPYEAVRLGAYFYALRANLQAKKAVNLPLLVKRFCFSPLTHFNEIERIGAYLSHPGPKRENVVSLNGRPMVHHYSWVRTKEECLCKTRTWGHRSEQNWPKLIEEAFSGKTESLFGTSHEFYPIDTPFFDPFAISYPENLPPPIGSHVKKIDLKTLVRKEIEHALI